MTFKCNKDRILVLNFYLAKLYFDFFQLIILLIN